jgi:hypothetical protein
VLPPVRIYESGGSYVDLNPGLMNVRGKRCGKQRGCPAGEYVGPRLSGKRLKKKRREKWYVRISKYGFCKKEI